MLRVHRARHCVLGGRRPARYRDLCQTEIQNLRVAQRRCKNICWFDVAVNNSLRMRRCQSIGNLDPQRQHRFGLQRTSSNTLLQRGAFQEFHCNEGSAVFLANIVNRADVGMIQR